jgi:LacI family transcriptional regulator
MKNVTIKDISRITGFSPMTVSRVVNDAQHVKKETKDKVISAINEYGYEPNEIARGLKTRRTNTLGLIIGDIENPYYSRLAKGVIDTAESADYSVVVCNSKYDSLLGEKYLAMLMKRGVDGLIVATIDVHAADIARIKKKNIPCVLVTSRLDEPPDVNYIVADDYRGGRLAAEYLVSLGHRRIFFLRAADVSGANERVRAFKDVLAENGIPFHESRVSTALRNSEESCDETKRFLQARGGCTAVIAGNDFIAVGAMEAIIESGLDIPGDLSLIGYDNLKIASILKVPLTTIDQPKLLFGRMSAERLIEMIRHPEERRRPKKIVEVPRLVVRESCRRITEVQSPIFDGRG